MGNEKKQQEKRQGGGKAGTWLRLSPLLFIVGLLPLISKQCRYAAKYADYAWFQESDTADDFFLYYKTVFFLAAAAVMLAMLIFDRIRQKKKPEFVKSFLPLAAYAVLILLSAVFSKYRSYVWSGCYVQFESVFVLLGYLLTAYYAFSFVQTEYDVRVLCTAFTVCAVLEGLVAFSQTVGHDFFATRLGERLLTSALFREGDGKLRFTMGDMAYGTMYNPNYLGVFSVMLFPVFAALCLAEFKKNKRRAAGYFIVAGLLLVALLGSKSKAGFLVIAGLLAVTCVFLWRPLLKRWYITVPVLAALIVLFFAVNAFRGNALINRLKEAVAVKKETPALTSFVTGQDGVAMKYKGHTVILRIEGERGEETIAAKKDGKELLVAQTGIRKFVIGHEAFTDVTIESGRLFGFPAAAVTAGGTIWYFINDTNEGRYFYINEYLKSIDCIEADSLFFEGYEKFATSRGYIWSRTLPLLKKNWFLGSGPNTFGAEFPQNEYVARYQSGFLGQIITKPHNMYLQIAVQTGIPSLLCFLAFCVLYLLRCCKLYGKGSFKSRTEKIGFGLFMAVLGFLVMAITNDSMIVTAPLFFALIGTGMAVNRMLEKERGEQKAQEEALEL